MTDTATERQALPAGAPPQPGLTMRTYRTTADYAILASIARAANLHDGEDYIPDAASMEAEYEHTVDLDPRHDIFIVEHDGEPVAWSSVVRQVRDGQAIYNSSGFVLPTWRRRGIGRWLLRTGEARNRARAAAFDDADTRVFGSWANDREAGAAELLAAEGYSPVRYGFSMQRPSLDDVPDAQLPDGLELRPVQADEVRRIWQADNEAFRDHWGHREQLEEDYARLLATPDLDTALWSVAWDGDEVAGSAQNYIWRSENEELGVRRGWLEHISVRRPWRRRGLARALIADSLRRLRDAGMDEAMLGVDSENPTGALELYRSLGFEVKDRGASYRKAWPADVSAG